MCRAREKRVSPVIRLTFSSFLFFESRRVVEKVVKIAPFWPTMIGGFSDSIFNFIFTISNFIWILFELVERFPLFLEQREYSNEMTSGGCGLQRSDIRTKMNSSQVLSYFSFNKI